MRVLTCGMLAIRIGQLTCGDLLHDQTAVAREI